MYKTFELGVQTSVPNQFFIKLTNERNDFMILIEALNVLTNLHNNPFQLIFIDMLQTSNSISQYFSRF